MSPGLTQLPWMPIFGRTLKAARTNGATDVAAMLAYYAFLAVPATLLLTLGVFTLVAGQDTVDGLIGRLDGVVPAEAVALVDSNLSRALDNQSGGIALIVVGGVFALWTATGAMAGLTRGLNRIYGIEENRPFLRQRLNALAMLGAVVLAFALVFSLLVLGPVLSGWVGEAVGAERAFGWIWWIAEWPILLGGLFLSFTAVLYLGPNVDDPRMSFVSPGAVLAISVWLVASGGFAFYVSQFGSYNKAWGALAGVIILLTWLWLSSLALLLGATLNVEVERGREAGTPG